MDTENPQMNSVASSIVWGCWIVAVAGAIFPLYYVIMATLGLYPVAAFVGIWEFLKHRKSGRPFLSHYLPAPFFALGTWVFQILMIFDDTHSDDFLLIYLGFVMIWPIVWGGFHVRFRIVSKTL